MAVAGGESFLTNETINGNFDLTTSNTNLYITGGLTINSIVNVGTDVGGSQFSTQFNVRDNQTWGGTGSLVFGGSTASSITSGVGRSLTIADDLTLRGKKLTIDSNLPLLTIQGTLAVEQAGGIFDISPVSVSNQGTVRAAAGGEFHVHSTNTSGLLNLTNQSLTGSVYTASLTGGNWYIAPSGTLRLYYNTTTSVQANALNADLTLDGGLSNVYGSQSTTFDALGAIASVGADGSLTVTGGRNLSPAGTFSSAGNLTVGNGSSFIPTGATYTQSGGSTYVQSGGTLLATGKSLQLQGGTLKGTGTVNADVSNTAGTVAPGNSPGFLDITGNYVQGPGGTLDLEIAGRDPNVPEFDRLRVTGTAMIDGAIHVDLLDGFQPGAGG